LPTSHSSFCSITTLAASRIRERSLGKMPRADPGDLVLRDPQPERLDHLVDLARRDAGDVRLLHDPLASLGTDQPRDLRLHQLRADPAQAVAQHVDALPLRGN
jgi:hypothetical protein